MSKEKIYEFPKGPIEKLESLKNQLFVLNIGRLKVDLVKLRALSNDPVVKISNLNIQMKIVVWRSYGPEKATVEEDMLISISELDEGIFTMANEQALLKAIHAYINDD